MKIQIFDPPMCCSTGVCGPSVDPELVRFAADLDWLKRQGAEVERYNLSQEPAAFTATLLTKAALAKEGNECLPLTLVDGVLVCKAKYPTREELAGYAGLKMRTGIFTDAVKDTKTNASSPCCGSSEDDVPTTEKKPGKRSCC
jgi:hypothetical protein